MHTKLFSPTHFFSPAKVNLQLSLFHKRLDGYYEIETLMQTISLCDRLIFRPAKKLGIHLFCTNPALATDESNLVVRAATLFQEITKIPLAVEIYLEKQIPFGAGLGGGSSNAATTFHALNTLYQANLSKEELQVLAAKVGSDVPFFFCSEGAAICRGRGEIVEESTPWQGQFFLLMPHFSLATSSVYGKFSDTFLRRTYYKTEKIPNLTLWNDLEAPAFFLSDELKRLRDEAQKSGFTVLMSGSGSSLLLFGEAKIPSFASALCKPLSFLQKSADKWYIQK